MATDTKNFKVSEFACKHCGKNLIGQRVINMAQIIREAAGVPIKINSGYRCEIHNKNVGGVTNSFHVQGKAADLSCELGAFKLFALIADLKVRGKLPDLQYTILYCKKNFVHIDCGSVRKLFFEVRP